MLWLSEAHAREMVHYARSDAPRETCGLIAGKGKVVQRVVPLPNAASDAQKRYLIDPAAYIRALTGLEKEGLSLIGFYHSHPDGEPIPSPTDIREAAYPDAVYVIVGLRDIKASLLAWQIRAGRVESVEICTETPTEMYDDVTLSRAQKFAIILSAVLALIFLVLLSLSLLPPAPVIPVP
jgi:proteasome lid subunit RPN8/RPN11